MTYVKRFRKRTPIEVEAVQIDGQPDTIAQASGWMLGHGFADFYVHGDEAPFGIAVKTPKGWAVSGPGDWIIRFTEGSGSFWPCGARELGEKFDRIEP